MGNVSQISDGYRFNVTRLAEGLGLSRDTVRKRLREAGVKPVSKSGNAPVYQLADAAEAVFRSTTESVSGLHDPSKMAPKDRKDWFQSETERLKVQTEQGLLIPEPAYRLDLYIVLSDVVSFFENLPDKMERTGLFDAAQLELLEQQGDVFREQLYERLKEAEPDA